VPGQAWSEVSVSEVSEGAVLTATVALWGAPSAAGLFRALIMQSDPMVRCRPSRCSGGETGSTDPL
jgi:carboxylesterase type B